MKEPLKQGQWVTLVQTCALSWAEPSTRRPTSARMTAAVFHAMTFPCEHVPRIAEPWAAWEFTRWLLERGEKPEWVPQEWADSIGGIGETPAVRKGG